MIRRHFNANLAVSLLALLSPFCLCDAQDRDQGQQRPDLPAIEQVAQWKLEQLELKDGTVHWGLFQAESETEIEFAEIFRPPGKPMFIVIRPIDLARVASTVRLEQADRRVLQRRFDQFRNRVRIEAGRMDKVTLTSRDRHGTGWLIYDGLWFSLESTADELMTRRSVVRVEQIFRAYRQMLPPRVEPPSSLRLLLFGSMEEYRAFLRERELDLASPAFYSASENLVVAGSQLNSYARQLRQVQQQNAETRRQYSLLKDSFHDRLAAVIQGMKQQGFNEDEIENEVKLRTAVWQREFERTMARLDLLDSQNDAEFAGVTQQVFARLYHEAFHAYVENYVYPERNVALPRWLNEGLAQVFESGQFEADTLRVDAPDPNPLSRLKADLAGDDPLTIVEVLTADEQDFLAGHAGETGQRCYLYSWGLAYYLAFERNLFCLDSLDPYVFNEDGFGPIARFTRLVGMPLPKFERQWREAILAM